MTENLMQQLEEKMMVVLSEIEKLRKENQSLVQENDELRMEKEKFLTDRKNSEKKLQDILSLFDAIKPVESPIINTAAAVGAGKPVLLQR